MLPRWLEGEARGIGGEGGGNRIHRLGGKREKDGGEVIPAGCAISLRGGGSGGSVMVDEE